jgi:hypothetical protein
LSSDIVIDEPTISLFREILGVIPDVEMVGSSITISLDKEQIRSLKK